MEYEEDFVNEDVVSLDVKGYDSGSFKYKPTTAGEELSWIKEYTKFDENNKPYQDFEVLNKFKFSNLVGVPWSAELIKKLVGFDMSWNDLSVEQKWIVIKKLKGGVFDRILSAIDKVDKGDDVKKKF